VPLHGRVRGIDRDLIRGGHYGQRSYEPHTKAEHMAAPTKAAPLQKVLANEEPSTHGTLRQPPDGGYRITSAVARHDRRAPD
jgi:hypothetical protein